MLQRYKRFLFAQMFMKPDDDGAAGGGAAAPAAAPAGAAPASAPAAPAPSPAAAAPAPSPAAAGDDDASKTGKDDDTGAAATPAAAPPPPAKKEDDATKGNWPDNWRETVSKGDAKTLARMQRYASPEALANALIAAQNRISSGELKPVLPKDASAEELTAWRKEHGVPDKPEAYDIKDVALDKGDAGLVAEVLKAAHATNQTPEQVRATLAVWPQIKAHVAQAQADRDDADKVTGEEELRKEWGTEFRRDINLVHGLLDSTADPALKANVLNGRLADGTLVANSPAALKLLLNLALVNNPTAVLVPHAGENKMQAIDDEISTIETAMRTDRAAYNRNEAQQARYRDLLGAREKLKERGQQSA